MTLSEKNIMGLYPTVQDEFLNIIQEMAKKVQTFVNPVTYKSLGKNTYTEAKAHILNDKLIQRSMMNYAIDLSDFVQESIDECYKVIRILMIKCFNGRINAFHINQRPGVTLMLRDKLKPSAERKAKKEKLYVITL